jgi:hypothetical protein
MNFRPYLIAFVIYLMCTVISGCNNSDGYTDLGDNISMKLVALGDCSPPMRNAEYFVVRTRFYTLGDQAIFPYDTLHTLYSRGLSNETLQPQESPIHWRIRKELEALNCGDEIELIAPLQVVNKTLLCAYQDAGSKFNAKRGDLPFKDLGVHIELKLLKTFDEAGFRDYLQSAAQHGEMTESEAIECWLANNPEHPYERHGECFIEPFIQGKGDSITSGSELTLSYTTHLLNGTQLDEPTEFQFTYGRPGQIIDGLHYALSFMQQGDEAIVYLPSNLAFGNNGSQSGIVPPRTPIYFKLKIADSSN